MVYFSNFLRLNYVKDIKKEFCYYSENSKSSSDGQEIDQKPKSLCGAKTGSMTEKVLIFILRWIFTMMRILLFLFYFVSHISGHVIEPQLPVMVDKKWKLWKSHIIPSHRAGNGQNRMQWLKFSMSGYFKSGFSQFAYAGGILKFNFTSQGTLNIRII